MESVTLSGTVKKRQFGDDEMTLEGIVLADSKDRRQFVNLDVDYLSGAGATIAGDVSDYLTVGRAVKMKIFRCRRIYYLARLLP